MAKIIPAFEEKLRRSIRDAMAIDPLMSVPALALFYGGLVRSKNMLSVLMQVFVVTSLIYVLWLIYGYSGAFTAGNPFIGSFDKIFFFGITPDSVAATFSKGVVIPEYTFAAFQATFAAITWTLIVGSFAERVKFSAVLLFCALWFTFSYMPVAHMVWYWDGPDAITDAKTLETVTANAGWLWAKGALDFAGGTVVHINAAMAGLVGAFMIGKRTGYGKESMAPHSLTLTMVGASLLWVGCFGIHEHLGGNGCSDLGLDHGRSIGQRQGLHVGCSLWCCGRFGGDHASLRICWTLGSDRDWSLGRLLLLVGCEWLEKPLGCR
jgi:Amt family ammonium transporter